MALNSIPGLPINYLPNTANPPTLADVGEAIIFKKKKCKRFKLDPNNVSIHDVVPSTIAENKIIEEVAVDIVTPPWFSQAIAAAMAPINQQLTALKLQLDNMTRLLATQAANSRSRLYNSLVVKNLNFQPIQSEASGNIGAVPANFPANRIAADAITAATLNQLESAYGEKFPGDNLAARRRSFLSFIGNY